MRLKALRLQGFKSFADRTEILFHDGITAIVGPNGCGKSNISDAIRWVLGEQRPTAVRGATMEEVIFQGTVARRPVNRGWVAIEVENGDGVLPVPFSEVEIARTVYRDGGSDYNLNRTACRLRDIQELCRDTGLGANAYSVIESRMIDAILSERAEERRGLFEEAAGVGKYKDRRRMAARRLERAEVDLQRLEDLVAEVRSKVRSLARQKGRAERYAQLRKRRLDLEVTLALLRSGRLEERLSLVRTQLEEGAGRDEGLRARIQAAESRVETIRIEQVSLEKERARIAARAAEIKDEIVRWERELAVAGERSAQARRRIAAIGEERTEAKARVQASGVELEDVRERQERSQAELTRVLESIAANERSVEEVGEELASARSDLREAEGLEHETTRRAAQLEGDVEAAEARRAERESVAESLAEELTEVRSALEESRSQGDLFTDQVAACKEKMEEGRRRVHGLEAEVSESREAFERLRGDELTAQDRAGQLAARRSALERMEEDREGLDPAVQAVLEDEVEGVEGILADFLEPEPEVSSAVEAYLGVHLRALVVRDSGVAERLMEWFGDTWDGGGGMLLLPLDRVSVAEAPGELLARVEVRGAGAPWVSALLDGVELSDAWGNGPESAGRLELDRVGRGGEWVERSGVVGVGNPFGAMDLLERRERLRSLGEEADRAEAEWASLRDRREAAQGELVELERKLDEARSSLREAEEGWRRAQAEEGERSERRARLERAIDELEARLVSTRADVKTSSARAEEAHKERQGLLERQGEVSERGAAARRRLDDVRETWEEIRDEGSRLAVERSRLEGEVVRAGERMEDIKRDRSATRERLDALSREEEELEDELERVRVQRAEGGVALEQLFELRDAVGEELGKADESAGELHERLTEAESGVRAARAEEREMSEGRHALELEASELEGKMARMRDRLEGEWARSFDQLVEEAEPVEEGSEDQLETEIRELAVTLDRLGPVNMLAVEEHQEESARLEFLVGQRDDLVRARDDLEKAIQEINRTATRLFLECFEAIRENFRDTFRRLFEGGECDLRLTDPDDPLESTIEIQAAPGGKRAQRIDLLSGGERALTALSLLFGIYLVKPSPFCVLDEVDAPLDESNIDRFIRLLQEFKDRSQFVVITHNPRTIEAADWIYGVTLEEPGVSSIVGVRLDEALETAGA